MTKEEIQFWEQVYSSALNTLIATTPQQQRTGDNMRYYMEQCGKLATESVKVRWNSLNNPNNS